VLKGGEALRETMEAVVDQSLCQGHGKCYLFVPEVFEVADDYGHAGTHATVPADDTALRTRVNNAIRGCPEDAIGWRKSQSRDPEGA
jgi:ferredoxin